VAGKLACLSRQVTSPVRATPWLRRAELLHISRQTLPHYAEVRRRLKEDGTPIPANDCWIAAIGKEHRLPVVSRDKHFDLVKGVRRIWW